MRTRPIYKIGAIVLSIVLIACGTGSTTDEATSGKINVLATTPVLGDFVNQIGGENINLTILMPPEVDPHTYDPSPQDATKIADADVVFYIGLKYEPSALIKLLENTSNSDSVLVEVGESINPIEFSEEGHDDHDEEGHDDETAKKHYSRVTDTDFERGSQLLTIGQKGNAGGNSYEAIRGHIAPNEKKEQLKPRENDTVASSVPSEMTPTGLEPVLPP